MCVSDCTHILYQSFKVVDDMRDDSLKLELENLTSDLTPDFTDWGRDPDDTQVWRMRST